MVPGKMQTLPNDSFEFRFMHASGPGGQHVNKASTAVELRVRLDALDLHDEARKRLLATNTNRINKAGELVIQADRFRSQLKNKKDAMERAMDLMNRAKVRPKRRIATKPTAASKRKRMDAKKIRGTVKSQRKKPRLSD